MIALRVRRPKEELVYRARPNVRFRGIDWPIFAFVGGFATLARLARRRRPGAGHALGRARVARRRVRRPTPFYRLRVLHIPLRETVRAPQIVLAGALEIDYRTIVVPVVRSAETEEALVAAARLAAERGATIVLVDRGRGPARRCRSPPTCPTEEAEADELLDEARALVEGYGVGRSRASSARAAPAPAIVEEAVRRNAELIVVGAGRALRRAAAPVFGKTVDYILKPSPVRVLVTAGKRAA